MLSCLKLWVLKYGQNYVDQHLVISQMTMASFREFIVKTLHIIPLSSIKNKS